MEAARLQLVDRRRDRLEIGGGLDPEALAAAGLGDCPQRFRIDGVGIVRAGFLVLRAEGDGIDGDAEPFRQPCHLGRQDVAGGVGAVGQKHHHPRARLALFEPFQRDAEAAGDRRGPPGNADHRLVDRPRHGGDVEGQRRRDIGFLSEQDEADPVAGAAGDEALADAFHRVEPGDGLAVEGKIRLFHRAGEVDGENEVAARNWQRLDGGQPLGPGQRGHERQPQKHRDGAPHPDGNAVACIAGQRPADAFRQDERAGHRFAPRQEPHREEGQRQQQEGQRHGKADHRRAPLPMAPRISASSASGSSAGFGR
mgnify:CR=1 FL=1